MKPPAGQLDLLAWEPPATTVRFEDDRTRAATWPARIARAIAATLTDSTLKREEIARRMSDFTGEKVSVNMLNRYASQAAEQHTISLPRFIAFIHATGDRRLLEMLAEPMDWAVVSRRDLPMIALAAVYEKEKELRQKRNELLARAKRGGAL